MNYELGIRAREGNWNSTCELELCARSCAILEFPRRLVCCGTKVRAYSKYFLPVANNSCRPVALDADYFALLLVVRLKGRLLPQHVACAVLLCEHSRALRPFIRRYLTADG